MATLLASLDTPPPDCNINLVQSQIDIWNSKRNKHLYAMDINPDVETVSDYIVASQMLKFLNRLNTLEEANIKRFVDGIVQESFSLLTRPAPEVTQTQWIIDRKVAYFRMAIIDMLYDYRGKEFLSPYIY